MKNLPILNYQWDSQSLWVTIVSFLLHIQCHKSFWAKEFPMGCVNCHFSYGKKTVRLSFTFILPFYLCFISEQENVFTCSVSLIFKQAKNFILPVTNHQHSKQQTCCSKHIQGHTLKKKHKLLHQACSLLFIEESGFHVKVLDKTFS